MENNKQQSAVDWLVDQVEDFIGLIPVDIIEQAKEMEKEQIVHAHLTGLIHPLEMEATKQACQYYNETYGQNKQLKIKLYNIVYETDGEDVKLPTEIWTTPEEMKHNDDGDIEWFVSEYGADYISEITGWLVNGFNFEIEKQNE